MTVTHAWACLTCPDHGDGPGSDRAAEKHTKTTRHATTSHGKATK